MAPGKLGKEARAVALDVVSNLQRAWGESPFYQAGLKGPAPDRLLVHPFDPRAPERAVAEALSRGRASAGAEAVDCEGEVHKLWVVVAGPGPLYAHLHGFSWLRHFSALGERGGAEARRLVTHWLDRCEKWEPLAWTPALTGERLVHLACNATMLLRGADILWRSRLLTSMARQTRHLARSSHRADTGYDRLMTAAGLTLSALCLPGCEDEIERGADLLRREIRLQIRPDGGHVGRNPSQQLALVVRLQMIAKALEQLGKPAPGFLTHTIGRAAANVQFFRSGDGRLAVFNGGYEDDAKCVLAAAEAADVESAPSGFAPHSGFQRLSAARSILIADTSAAKGGGRFESAGSLHFSSGRSRIVVNCGNGGHLPGEWSKALAQAAAHSTLSAEPPGAAAALFAACGSVHRRAEDSRGQLLEIERRFDEEDRDGPRAIRRIFLSAAGDNLRGEDVLHAPPPALAAGWRVRFHLHPDVKASQARDGRSVILSLPNREGWRFRANADELRLEKSVYLGAGGMPQPCEQIVLAPSALEAGAGEVMLTKWAFQRLDGAWSAEGRSEGV